MDEEALSHAVEVAPDIAPVLVVESDDLDPVPMPSAPSRRVVDQWRLEGARWEAIGPQCFGALCRGGPSLGFGGFDQTTKRCSFCSRYAILAEWRSTMGTLKRCGNCLKEKDSTEFDPMETNCRNCNRVLTDAAAARKRRETQEATQQTEQQLGSSPVEAEPEHGGNGRRICSKCGIGKDDSEFSRLHGNPRSQCKACVAAYQREYKAKKTGAAVAAPRQAPNPPEHKPPASLSKARVPATESPVAAQPSTIEPDDFTWAVRVVKFGMQPGDESRLRRVLAKLLIADLQEIASGNP